MRAKKLGDKLIVAVSTDKFNSIKGKKAIIPYKQRKKIVENIKCVDMVIPEYSWKQKESDIKKYNVDILVMGHDWKGKFDSLNKLCKVVCLPRTKRVSSSMLKHTIKKTMHDLENIFSKRVKKAIEILRQLDKDLK